MSFSLAHASDVLAWFVAFECYSAQISTVSLNKTKYSDESSRKKNLAALTFVLKNKLKIATSALRGVSETAHKT